MMRYLFGGVLLFLVGLVIYLYFYLGFRQPVEMRQAEMGPYAFIYKDHIGAYHQIESTMRTVEAWASQQNLTCTAYGEFIDDPKAVDQDRLRSRVGCVVPGKPAAALPEGIKYEERPAAKYLVATFAGAPSIGPFKVYPKVEEYFQENRLKMLGPVIEIYHVNGSRVLTEYLFQL